MSFSNTLLHYLESVASTKVIFADVQNKIPNTAYYDSESSANIRNSPISYRCLSGSYGRRWHIRCCKDESRSTSMWHSMEVPTR